MGATGTFFYVSQVHRDLGQGGVAHTSLPGTQHDKPCWPSPTSFRNLEDNVILYTHMQPPTLKDSRWHVSNKYSSLALARSIRKWKWQDTTLLSSWYVLSVTGRTSFPWLHREDLEVCSSASTRSPLLRVTFTIYSWFLETALPSCGERETPSTTTGKWEERLSSVTQTLPKAGYRLFATHFPC